MTFACDRRSVHSILNKAALNITRSIQQQGVRCAGSTRGARAHNTTNNTNQNPVETQQASFPTLLSRFPRDGFSILEAFSIFLCVVILEASPPAFTLLLLL
jgi:hypothetical protein